MKPLETVRRKVVAEWLRKAELDLDSAVQLQALGAQYGEVVAFHAQQAVEKFLKALLSRHGVDPPKTHDIETLLDRLETVGEKTGSMRNAKALTPFGVEIRYPSDIPELLPGATQELIGLARMVRDTVIPLLEPYLADA